MSDDSMPYEKAAEETAKAANNAVDLFREGGRAIGPSIGNIYGLLIGDPVADARLRRLDKLARKTKKILKDRDLAEQQEVPEDIAIPLLEAAQGESREEIQELWARLLANAMDPQRSNNVRAEFIGTVRKLEPVDAQVFLHMKTLPEGSFPSSGEIAKSLSLRETAVLVSVENLVRLQCLDRHPEARQAFRINSYGKELLYGLER
jgi:Abortive infection alpha